MQIHQPDSSKYEPEYRMFFIPENPNGAHVVLQGSVDTESMDLKGFPVEEYYTGYEVHLLVGPFWKDVQSVVPRVSLDGYMNSNSDEDDEQGWYISDLQWDTVGEVGHSNDELRIRLKFQLSVKGDNTLITRIGYYLTAHGRKIGYNGLNQPGPVKQQG